jgi:ubiquitin-like 1-activating enzyme E1 B
MAAEEIANLRKEAEALKAIKLALGTEEFVELVFEKVFSEDIKRLLSMSDMWKTRTPPIALRYKDYAVPLDVEIDKIAKNDQKVWDLLENISVFKHRYVLWKSLIAVWKD